MQHSSYYSLQAVVYFINPSYFFHRERERDCFQPHVFREYKHKSAHFCVWWKYQIMPTKTPCIPPKTPNTPTKIPMWICININLSCFVAKKCLSWIDTIFFAYFFQAKKIGGIQKITNMKYDWGYCMTSTTQDIYHTVCKIGQPSHCLVW